MAIDYIFKPTGKINRRDPANEGEFSDVLMRENLLARNGKLRKVRGTERVNPSSALSDIAQGLARYYTIETGLASPKTFVYTKDGNLYVQDDQLGTETLIKSGLNVNAYPRQTLIKTGNQTKMYLCDGDKLYRYDGNNDHKFEDVGVTFKPFDVEEHLDRLWAIDSTTLYGSANFDFENFTNATDSFEGIVGSGKGKNLGIIRLNSVLYIFTTEGIFRIYGDTISATANTFSILPVSDKRAISAGSICKVENGILFIGDDYELYSFNGTAQPELLSFKEKLSLDVNTYEVDQMVSTYYNNYYMLSFVEKGKTYPTRELWWDALENKIDFVVGRNVSCYLDIDSSREFSYQQTGRSDTAYVMWTDRGHNFDDTPITVRLITKDITPSKFEEVRFSDFYFDIEPIGDRDVLIRYLLDSRLSEISGSNTAFTINLEGEVNYLGLIKISNQRQFWAYAQPKINYARGTSICFEVYDATKDIDFVLGAIGINFITDK